MGRQREKKESRRSEEDEDDEEGDDDDQQKERERKIAAPPSSPIPTVSSGDRGEILWGDTVGEAADRERCQGGGQEIPESHSIAHTKIGEEHISLHWSKTGQLKRPVSPFCNSQSRRCPHVVATV